jgi:hypothetical protein
MSCLREAVDPILVLEDRSRRVIVDGLCDTGQRLLGDFRHPAPALDGEVKMVNIDRLHPIAAFLSIGCS